MKNGQKSLTHRDLSQRLTTTARSCAVSGHSQAKLITDLFGDHEDPKTGRENRQRGPVFGHLDARPHDKVSAVDRTLKKCVRPSSLVHETAASPIVARTNTARTASGKTSPRAPRVGRKVPFATVPDR